MKRSLFATLLAAIGFPLTMNAEPLAVGAPAPKVTAVDQDGKSVDLKDVYAKGPTLVYFYPKSDTPGCTAQACSLRDDWSELQGKNIQVIAVSGDNTESQKKFQEKYKLPFTVVADTEGKLADAFGVPRNGNIASRQSFLIKDGRIVWNMLKASTANHSKDVLKAYEEASKS
jgi:peroxiredoxin Q/BCP